MNQNKIQRSLTKSLEKLFIKRMKENRNWHKVMKSAVKREKHKN